MPIRKRALIICCEDGEVEYDEAELEKKSMQSLVMVENEEEIYC